MQSQWQTVIYITVILISRTVLSGRDECYFKVRFCDCFAESEQGPVDLTCHSFPSRQDLRGVTKSFPDVPINNFFISNSDLKYLPGNLFRGTRIKRLEISSSPLTAITESNEQAFIGLEYTLRELVLRYCKLTNKVNIASLRGLEVLQSLDLSFNPLEEIIDEMFSMPPEDLKELYLKNCSLKYLSLNAFESLPKLIVLDLSENLIVQVSRTMLPQPATHLQFLYLSYNRIHEFPNDFFTNMTNLRVVYADNNVLRHLPEKVWKEVWMNSPKIVDFLGNDIVCDEGVCWLTFWDATFLRGSCSEPDSLRGRRFLTLWPWNVNCNETLYHGNLSLPIKPHF